MRPFKHKPIDLEGHIFRLLRVLKGSSGNVRCEIFDAYLGDRGAVKYEALSYTWGGLSKAYDVEVNGRTMAVTHNLLSALLSLRSSHQDRILWIDAICIDQDNDKERGHQVRQMGSIYAKAEQVLVWLGPATLCTDVVFDSMFRFETETARQDIMGFGYQLAMPQQAEGFSDLLTRAWFDRVWIIQEVANARAIRVICGAKSVSALTFTRFLKFHGVKTSLHRQAVLDLMPGRHRNHFRWTRNHDLYTLLKKFRGSKASDQRDKIFALLGISSDRCITGFPVPDYEKSEVEIVQKTIVFLLQLPSEAERCDYAPAWTLAEFMQHLDDLPNRTCFWAAENGNEAVVKLLLDKRKANPNFRNNQGQTPLLRAVEAGHMTIVRLLIGSGKTDLNVRNQQGLTPLPLATRFGNQRTIDLILESRKLDVNAQDPDGKSSLLSLTESGHQDIIEFILGGTTEVFPRDGYEMASLRLPTKTGHQKIVEPLSEGKVDVNTRDWYGRTPLLLAAKNGNQKIVELLLNRKAKVNTQDRDGQTPLLVAAKNGHKKIVELILDTNAVDTEVRDVDGWNSLWRAAMEGLEATVCTLLRIKAASASKPAHRISLETERKIALELMEMHKKGFHFEEDQRQLVPLAFAAECDNMTLFKLFLEVSAVDIERLYIRNTLLIQWAAENRRPTVVKLLLDTLRVDLTPQDTWVQTLLQWAAENADSTTIGHLVATGHADALFKASDCRNMIEYAITMGHKVVVDLLLKSGSMHHLGEKQLLSIALDTGGPDVFRHILNTWNIDINRYGEMALRALMSTKHKANGEVYAAKVEVLLEHPGFKMHWIDSKDAWSRTPLHRAAKDGLAAIVRVLIDTKSANVNNRDIHGTTPFSLAARIGHADVVKVLLETQNVDVNTRDGNGLTSLSLALQHVEVMRLLLKTENIDVSIRNYDGETLLAQAAKRGFTNVVALMLETDRFDVNSRDEYGLTPLSRAKLMGRVEVVKVLEKHGAS